MSLYDLIALLPEFILTITGVVLMLMGAFQTPGAGRWCSTIALAGLLGSTEALIYGRRFPGLVFGGMFSVDPFGRYFSLLFFLIAALVVLASVDYIRRERLPAGEYYALLLFATVGMVLMASGNELILIFIGLEISSLSSYVLVGFRRDVPSSSEAALKYFLLGSFATAFFLYGIALLFGVTGSTRLTQIRSVLHGGEHPITASTPAIGRLAEVAVRTVQLSWREAGFPTELLGLAIALIFVGLAFKISAAPFQAWTPDVYQGAPTPVAAFLSTGPKAAAFAAFLRIFQYSLPASAEQWSLLLWASALLTMFIGNLAALWQSNLKRLLAYSSIAHAGYMLVAFTAHSSDGVAAVLFYLAAYAFMNIGAFVVVSHLSGRGERHLELDDYAGLGYRSPALAACLSIFLLSLIGIPLTGGFLGKFYVFRAALRADLIWLTVFGVLNSAIASYYYLRILVSMYMQTPESDAPVARPGAATQGVLVMCTVATFLLGIFPQPVLRLVTRAARWFPTG
ncbi:MAG: NADH-quinone oxidoreductase subunit N [Acidobacteria bacterium]|nr:NADH-quinone oxidoreductase subunit N [Acidobacteriota bacterium]